MNPDWRWYATDRSYTWNEDYAAFQQDVKQGNPHALRIHTQFTAWRMKQ